ncbi:hypothetical protein ACI64O_002150, partial [Neisseria gonorrhoeae]
PARAGMTAADARRSLFLFIRHIVLKHRPEPDIIRPSTSVKIFFFNRSNRYKEPKMNPARKKPSLLFSSLLFSSLPQRRRQVKTMAAARMCRRI